MLSIGVNITENINSFMFACIFGNQYMNNSSLTTLLPLSL